LFSFQNQNGEELQSNQVQSPDSLSKTLSKGALKIKISHVQRVNESRELSVEDSMQDSR
jgi:uncharacterized protein (UPF0335 family)